MRTEPIARTSVQNTPCAPSLEVARARTETAAKGVLIATADPEIACGIGDFTHRLMRTLRPSHPTAIAELRIPRPRITDLWHHIGAAYSLVLNLPLVGWKRSLLTPILATAAARLRGRRAIVLMHEWNSLNWKRRLSYWPIILLANRVVTFSPQIKDELQSDRRLGPVARKTALAPLPPNITRPTYSTETPFSQRLAAARARGALVIGVFGSIYPGKQPESALEVAARLKADGHVPLIAFIGSFISAGDRVEENFWRRIRKLGLEENVAVSGYVASDQDLFGIFANVDVFLYRLSEGLTARRASVLTAAQSGRPVVVTEPARAEEFDHHPLFEKLVEKTLVLVNQDAGAEGFANAIVAVRSSETTSNPIDIDAWWRDTAAAVTSQV